jgi:hypothetical protein
MSNSPKYAYQGDIKEAIVERAKRRSQMIQVTQIDLKSDANHSLTPSLSPIDAWEMVAKLSKEFYFLHTGIHPSDRVDKTVVHITQQER